MKRREQWRPVLDAEIKKWNAKSCAELVGELVGLKPIFLYALERHS